MDSDTDVFGGISGGPVPGGNMPSATVDAHGTVVAWSHGAQWLFGPSPPEAVGRPVADLLSVDASELVDFADYPAAWLGEVSARDRDDAHLRLRLHAQPLVDARGTLQWHLTVLGRVSEPARATSVGDVDVEQLREWTLAQSPLPVTIFDHKGRVVEANASMVRLMGVSAEQAVGLRLRELAPLPSFAEFDQLLDQALSSGKLIRHEVFGRLGEGTRERSWTIFFAPVKDGTGQVHGVACTVFDTSAQHWARRRLSVLDEAGTRIGTTLDMTRTAEEAAEVLVPRFADSVFVSLLESVHLGGEPTTEPFRGPATLRCVAHRSVLGRELEGTPTPGDLEHYPEDSPIVLSLTERRHLVHRIGDPYLMRWLARVPHHAAAIRAHGIHSLMLIPLLVGDAPIGLVGLLRHRRTDPFGDDDITLARDIAAKAAVRIDNARRYTRERTAALTLQRSLLPQRMPPNSAVEVATRYLPAGTEFGIGGDWYDVIPLSGARVALVVGDVTGHGLHASATMGRLRTAVRTLSDVDLSPEELLTYLDDLVLHLNTEEETHHTAEEEARLDLHSEIGATCLYAIYDPVSRRCSMAGAGHPPPAVVYPDGTVDFVDLPVSPLLGVGGMPFESVEFELPAGSLLVFYTNGLVDSREHGLEQGLDRLRDLLAEPAESLEATCDSLVHTLLPEGTFDDAALLVARTRAPRRAQGGHVGPALRPLGRRRGPVLGHRAARRLGAGGVVVHHRTGRQRTRHQRHPLRQRAHPGAADPERLPHLRGLRRQQHRPAPAPGAHLR
ncbi:PAS domain S-box-containing protein [Thermobifida halotolerans]